MQQSYAKSSTLREPVRPADLIDDALRMNLVSFERHNVEIVSDFSTTPLLLLDKHKVLQILINLISNAKNAVKTSGQTAKRIELNVTYTPASSTTAALSARASGLRAEGSGPNAKGSGTNAKGSGSIAEGSGSIAESSASPTGAPG